MKYNVQAIEFREEMINEFRKTVTERAERIAAEEKRETVSEQDMGKLFFYRL